MQHEENVSTKQSREKLGLDGTCVRGVPVIVLPKREITGRGMFCTHHSPQKTMKKDELVEKERERERESEIVYVCMYVCVCVLQIERKRAEDRETGEESQRVTILQ